MCSLPLSPPASSPASSTASAHPGIEGRTWLVTGAARGLGLCLARQLAAQGARVLALSRGPVAGMGHIPCDLSDEASILAAAARVPGPIHHVIHNAAIRGDTGGLATLTADDLAQVMRVNVAGPLVLTRALLPRLAPGAVITFISSRAGSFTEGRDPDGDYAYCLSKAALNRAVAKLADDLPFRVLALHPGWIRTGMGGAEAPGAPEDAAADILHLLSAPALPCSGSFTDRTGRAIAP